MKSRFSARETALILIPALALGAFALYSQRVENVTPRGLYVEKSEIMPVTPLDRSRGYSHYLTVTLNYGGAKPDWWAKDDAFNELMVATPSTFRWTNQFGREFPQRRRAFAIGDELSVKRGGKSVVIPLSGFSVHPSVEEGRYVLKHSVALPQVPVQAGEVTFRSIYALRELEPLRWQKVVRRAGEKTLPPFDRNPHAKIVAWRRDPAYLPAMELEAQIKHPPRESGKRATIQWDGLEIMDSRGSVFRYGPDFMYGVLTHAPETGSPALSWGRILVHPNPLMSKTARPPLTLHGKISVNQNWPIPFSHRLSP